MNANDQAKFKEIIIGLADLYRIEITGSQVKTYWELLKCLTVDELGYAAKCHMSDTDQGMYFPKPAHLLRAVYGDSSTRKSEAVMAWDELRHQLGTENPDIGEKTKTVVSRVGGIYNLKRMTNKDLDFYRNEFISTYCENLKAALPAIAIEGGSTGALTYESN